MKQTNSTKRCTRTERGFTLVEIMIVVLVIGILLAIAIPNFLTARETARAKSCISNLSKIDTAKTQYIMDHNASSFANAQFPGDSTLGGIVPDYIRYAPSCPENGVYNTGDYSQLPTCSVGANSSIPHQLT